VRAMKDTPKVDYTLLSTTTSLGRVRGFTIDLLYHLRDGPKRLCELVEITEKSRFYVWRYLKNMQNYGLTSRDGYFWKLTDIGVNFVMYLDDIYNIIIISRKKEERKKKESKKKVESSPLKRHEQVSISPFLRDSSLDDTEKEVVEMLVNHYNKTGSKFMLVKNEYELGEKLKKNPQDIQPALAGLRQDNIIYLMRAHDFPGYHKLGLKKAFIESLKLGKK